MIYLKDSTTTYSVDAHRNQTQGERGTLYNYPFKDLGGSVRSGLSLQEVSFTPYVTTLSTIPWKDIIAISFDNTTWQTVYLVDYSLNTVPGGSVYPFTVNMIVSPLKTGTNHTYPDKWGLDTQAVSQDGNHASLVKLTYYAPRFYFPFTQSLVDFAGSAVIFTRASTKSYGGVTYAKNEPVFDDGLYIGTDDVAELKTDNPTKGTILFKLKYKESTTTKYILKNSDFYVKKNATTGEITLTKGATVLTVSYNNADYEAGDDLLIGIKWDTTTYLACAKWDSTNLTFDAATLDTDSAAMTLTFRDTYLGSNGTADWLKDIFSDFIYYDYEVDNWTTAKYNLTLDPLRFNNFYIQNTVAGTIILEDGVLTDENDNDITFYTSGELIELTSGDVEMKEGLSAKWTTEIKDCFVL